jgi:hypothetical protein
VCEFTVLLDDGKEKKQVAKNVVKAKIKDGKAVLMDTVGGVTKVENATITVVDTMMVEMVLLSTNPSPINATPRSDSRHSLTSASLPEELIALKKFHGHLGPYVVLGLRIGRTAREIFPKKIHATVLSGGERPRSCMADGVQFSSCCTIGKSNIVIKEEGQAKAIFTDGRTSIEIQILPSVISRIDEIMTHDNEEELSIEMFDKKDDDLFKIVRIDHKTT